MIEKSTQATGIMTAYFKRLSHLVPGAAISFDPTNRCHHPVTDAWIFCHVHIPPDSKVPVEFKLSTIVPAYSPDPR